MSNNFLKELRESKGLRPEQVAAAINCSVGSIYMWETGKAHPQADNVIKLAQFYGVSSDKILGLSK